MPTSWKIGLVDWRVAVRPVITRPGPRSPAMPSAIAFWRPVLPHGFGWMDRHGAVRLPGALEPADDFAPRTGPAARLAFHPLVVDTQVLIADTRSVTSYHLLTGQRLFRFGLKGAAADDGKPTEGRHTLTAWNGAAFARLGRPTVGTKADDDKSTAASTLVAIELSGPKAGSLRRQVAAETPEKALASFAGAPLAMSGRVFCAVSWAWDSARTRLWRALMLRPASAVGGRKYARPSNPKTIPSHATASTCSPWPGAV